MAVTTKRPRILNGVGMVAQPPQLVLGAKGEITLGLIQQLNGWLQDVASKLNGRLTSGTGEHATQAGNFDEQWVEGETPSVADTQFAIYHGLGRLPVFWKYIVDRACIIYTADVGSWNKDVIFAKCNVASVIFRMRLE